MITCELHVIFAGVILTMESWPLLTLEEAGITLYDCVHDTPKIAESDYPWISIPEMKNGFLDFASARTISEEDFTKWTKGVLPQRDDVVISRRANPGVNAPVLDNTPFALGQNLIILRADGTKVLPEFLQILISSYHWDNQVFSFINTGAVFESLTCNDIQYNMRLPIPSKTIQREIIKFIHPIDSVIEMHNPISKTLSDCISSIFRSWFIDFDPVKSKAGGKLPHGMDVDTAALFPDSFVESEFGQIPVGWVVKEMTTDFEFQKGFEPGRNNCNEEQIGTQFLRVGDLTGSSSAPLYVETSDGPFAEIGDTLSTFDGTPGHSTILKKGYFSSGIRKIIPLNNNIQSWFPHYLVNTPKNQWTIIAYSTGTTILHASSAIQQLKWVYPGEEIINAFQDFIDPVVTRLIGVSKEQLHYANLRDALLTRLMSGELSVS